jgi:nitrite reductase/ring-hydroxylating ferredoxin subunit
MAAMAQFVDVARLDHIVAGAAALVTVGGTCVAVFNVNGELHAVEDACVNCASSIAAGVLVGSEVTCAGCGWCYDVTTGVVKSVPALRITTFEVKTVGARIMVADSVKPDRDPG